MCYRPENTNIDRGEAEVNIGIFWSISHRIQCLNSQQLFYYITLKQQRKKHANNSAALMIYMYQLTVFLLPFFFNSVMRKPTFSVYENEDADQLRGNHATVIFAAKIVGPFMIR